MGVQCAVGGKHSVEGFEARTRLVAVIGVTDHQLFIVYLGVGGVHIKP